MTITSIAEWQIILVRSLLLIVGGVLLSGCATLMSDLDPPKVSLESFRSLPSDTGVPRFEIRLRVANPNNMDLDVAGISYSIELQGKELISGLTNEVPLIEPYSDEVVTLEASLQLIQLIRLLASAGQGIETPESLEYRFKAKIDFNGFLPTQRVEESGQITLQAM